MAKTKSKLGFEELMAELEQRLDQLEQGDLTLDETLAAYAQGVELLRQCQQRLEAAQETLAQEAGGEARP